MKKEITILTGRIGSGKDFECEENLKESDKYFRLKFATPMKIAANEIFTGIDIEDRENKNKLFEIDVNYFIKIGYNSFINLLKLEKTNENYEYFMSFFKEYVKDDIINISPRIYQQVFGNYVARGVDDEIFIKALKDEAKDVVQNHIYITDGRYVNEVNNVASLSKENFNVTVKYILKYKLENGVYKTFNENIDYHESEEMNNNLERVGLEALNKNDFSIIENHIKQTFDKNINFVYMAKEWVEKISLDYIEDRIPKILYESENSKSKKKIKIS